MPRYLIIGVIDRKSEFRDSADFFVVIGDNKTRAKILKQLQNDGYSVATIIHPSATLEIGINIGVGTVVMPGVIVNCSTTIGVGCNLNTACSIDHDNKIGNFAHLSPGVRCAGNVIISDLCWIGMSASLINNLFVGENSIVGAGAVVLKFVDDQTTVVGVPARIIKKGD